MSASDGASMKCTNLVSNKAWRHFVVFFAGSCKAASSTGTMAEIWYTGACSTLHWCSHFILQYVITCADLVPKNSSGWQICPDNSELIQLIILFHYMYMYKCVVKLNQDTLPSVRQTSTLHEDPTFCLHVKVDCTFSLSWNYNWGRFGIFYTTLSLTPAEVLIACVTGINCIWISNRMLLHIIDATLACVS